MISLMHEKMNHIPRLIFVVSFGGGEKVGSYYTLFQIELLNKNVVCFCSLCKIIFQQKEEKKKQKEKQLAIN